MGLLRILLIIGAIYLVYTLVKQWLFPMVMKYAANKVQQEMQDHMRQFSTQAQGQSQRTHSSSAGFRQPKEGEVHIDYQPTNANSRNAAADDGEYVEFEEIR